MNTLRLEHAKDYSAVCFVSDKNTAVLDPIIYSNPAHRYSADSAYKSLVTQMHTYGEKEMSELYEHYLQSERNKKR